MNEEEQVMNPSEQNPLVPSDETEKNNRVSTDSSESLAESAPQAAEESVDSVPSPQAAEESVDSVPSSQAAEESVDSVPSPQAAEESENSAPSHQTEKETATQEGAAEQTRSLPETSKLFFTTTSEISEKTRVGSSTAPQPKREEKAVVNRAQKPKPAVKQASRKKQGASESVEKKKKASVWTTFLLALVYITIVVGIAATLSVYVIRWGNDIFALVKEEVSATVVIPEDATISEVAAILKEHRLIEYPTVFRMYIGFKNRNANPPLSFQAGEYELKSTLNYDQIVSLIKMRKKRQIVTITIPEGFTVDEIIDLFVLKGMGTREGFEEAINQYPYRYQFMEKLNEIELSPDRKYRLEGYLFPDTYDFYTDSAEVAIVDKMLTAFETRFAKEYYDRLDELGMNLDEAITLASIVQKEGKFSQDFYPISGVFHNRLNSRDLLRLQSDATIQ